MSRIDLHKLALRMKIVEMLNIHLGRRRIGNDHGYVRLGEHDRDGDG